MMSGNEQKILVVVTGVETSSHVLDAAVEHAVQAAASLVVLHVMPYHVYENSGSSRATIPDLKYDGFTFTYDQATESAESVAERAAQTAIGDRDVPYTAVGRVGDFISTVLAAAATYECDTVFLQKTYPWWQRVLGRGDRRLAKRFDGTVVRVPRPVPQNLKTTRQLSKN
jgi:nucleotide-binding universal stress UspA family protein